MEAAAEEEISEITKQKEMLEQRKAVMKARQQLAEKEREDMGVMWGIGWLYIRTYMSEVGWPLYICTYKLILYYSGGTWSTK